MEVQTIIVFAGKSLNQKKIMLGLQGYKEINDLSAIESN